MLAYLRRDGASIPFWHMATLPVADLRARARALGAGTVVDTAAVTGGGTLPGVEIPAAGVALPGDRATELRAAAPPIIARVQDDTTILDLRTVDPAADAHVAAVLAQL
jgi:L-seryl-tRNA(Ser) seleniumtransferase